MPIALPPQATTVRTLDVDTDGDLIFVGRSWIHGWHIFNNDAAAVFVKIYDVAVLADETSDIPILTIGLGAGGHSTIGMLNIPFALGISLRVSTVALDTDATDVGGLSDVIANLFFTH